MPLPAIAIGVVGILICVYGCVVIYNYGTHIQRNWARADWAKEKIPSLNALWKGNIPDSQHSRSTLPRESVYLLVIVIGFLILFAGIGLASLVATFCR